MGVFVIAEAGVNHNGSLETAKRLVDAAVEAKADAVKFQTFRAESLVCRDAPKAEYPKRDGEVESQYEMLKSLELSLEAFRALKCYCDESGILFLSTPFDERSAEFLVRDLGMERVKIGSGEITNLPFLEFVAGLGRPVILSTGMSFLEEVRQAVETMRGVSPEIRLTLLHCTTSYPCPFEEVNLNAMRTLRETFRVPVGYSDHTLGIEIAVAAAALGAEVIEKHFTLDRRMGGPDHAASLEPDKLRQMVLSIRNVERSMGDGRKEPTSSEEKNKVVVRKSLVSARGLKRGSLLREGDIVIKRPAGGIPPSELQKVIGRTLRVDKGVDELLTWQDVQ